MPANNCPFFALGALLVAATQLCGGGSVSPQGKIAKDGRSFETEAGKPFVPFGVNYYRPGTGWAPQVWKQFDRRGHAQGLCAHEGAGR